MTGWAAVPAAEHAGATGVARWRPLEVGSIRVRTVDDAMPHRSRTAGGARLLVVD